MSDIIFVKPKDGKIVLHPEFPHAQIPDTGRRVRKTPYWKRMEKQGAVEISIPEDKEEVKDGQL